MTTRLPDWQAMYEKCAHCWHFIERNASNDEFIDYAGTQDQPDNQEFLDYAGAGWAEYVHLDNGEIEYDHDAAPSGDRRTLEEWKRDQPSLFHVFPDDRVGPNSVHFIPEFATAWECADNCDTCWWLLSVGPESAEAELGEDLARAKLRKHIASGHTLTSEEC